LTAAADSFAGVPSTPERHLESAANRCVLYALIRLAVMSDSGASAPSAALR